ncbi:hypothetical protein [Paraglaciecola marina]|uniref:hypothetical protein n=1 Tax=Paraglaciecola marina TaxID=2500157 RepID=UPI001061DF1C|nr:hypothetical protein [Paraglaciecola marina]
MTLLKKLCIATFCSATILIVAILPAEYGIDPTGLGDKLGLLALSKPSSSPSSKLELSFNIGDYDPKAERINESVQGLIHLEEVPFQSQVIDIEIEDLGEVEYKFVMPADSSFVYSWEVLNSREGVYYDFHGHPSSADAKNYPDKFEMAYARGEGTSQNGSFTSPFTGYHGFYFMNIEESAITVRLVISGYWQDHQEMYRAIEGKVIKNVKF